MSFLRSRLSSLSENEGAIRTREITEYDQYIEGRYTDLKSYCEGFRNIAGNAPTSTLVDNDGSRWANVLRTQGLYAGCIKKEDYRINFSSTRDNIYIEKHFDRDNGKLIDSSSEIVAVSRLDRQPYYGHDLGHIETGIALLDEATLTLNELINIKNANDERRRNKQIGTVVLENQTQSIEPSFV